MRPEEILEVFRDSGALLEGHFELRSGLHSDRFFQCANVLRYPRLAERLCAALADRMRATFLKDAAADWVIAPALGGILVGYEVARALDVRSVFVEKRDDKLAMRRFEIGRGERYIVAEDVITRGGRTQETVDIVEQGGGLVAGIGVLVDRSAGTARFKYPLVSLLEMAPVTYDPQACPLCARKLPIVHPGS